MAEIADEELNGVLPRKLEPVSKEFLDIGYYKDENGYTRFGVIPKKEWNTPVRFTNWNEPDQRNITSNPRYR